LKALIQESLSVATRTKAIKPSELSRVIVDTTVQPKNVTFPTDAKLLNRAREKLVRLAQLSGIGLRQSYARVGKFALIQHQRYAHAKQFKRANRMLKKLRTLLGRVIRDIGHKIENNDALEVKFAKLLLLARRVREQKQHQRGPKVYSLHAPEVECIGKGKAHRPYEFGVKVSVATTLKHCKGGQFVTHVKALPGNPYGGHRDPGHGGARRQHHRAHPRRQGIPRPQCAARPQVQGLPLRSETRRDAEDQARIAPQVRRRARHRPSQSRAPHGPQLSLVPSGRCCQRRPRRRRLQLPPLDPLANAFVATNPDRALPGASDQSDLRSEFFTDDGEAAKE
jgi:hypothetical protein